MLVITTEKFKYQFYVYNTNMKEELLNNVNTFFSSAELVYNSKDYTSAATLYFKTIFVALDLILFNKIKKTPKDHSERFRILEKEFPETYQMLDKLFPIYRSTYSTTIDQETCEEIRKNVKKLLNENFGI